MKGCFIDRSHYNIEDYINKSNLKTLSRYIYIHLMEYYSALKSNKILIHAVA